MSFKRFVIVALLGSVGLLLLLELLGPLVDLDRHRSALERRLSEAAGLDVVIAEPLEVHVIPAPRLVARDVAVANLENRPSPHLLRIAWVDFVLDWRALIRGVLEIDRLHLVGIDAHIETDPDGGFGVKQDVDSLVDEQVAGPLDLRIRSVEVEDTRVFFRDGRDGSLVTLRIERLLLDTEDMDSAIDIEARGEIDGAAFDLAGTAGALRELLAPTAPYPVELAGRLFEAAVDARGTIGKPLAFAGVDIEVAAEIAHLPELPIGATGETLSGVGPVVASGRLQNPAGPLGVSGLSITAAGGPGVRATASGAIEDLAALRGVALELQLDAERLALLEPLIEQSLPGDLALHATASVSDRDGSLGIAGTARAATPDGRLSLAVRGEEDDLRNIAEVDLEIVAHARDLAELAAALDLPLELPPIGPVDGTARLRDREGILALEGVKVTLGSLEESWAEVAGTIDDLRRFRGVSLAVSLRSREADVLAAKFGRKIPDIGSLEGTARLADLDGSIGLETLELHGGRKGTLSIDVSGALDDLRGIDEVDFGLRLEAGDLSVIGNLFGVALPAIGPFEFSGRVTGSDESIASNGSLLLGRTRITGHGSGSFAPGTQPSFAGRIEAGELFLEDVGLAPRFEGALGGSAKATELLSEWFRRPLPFELLHGIDLDLDVRAGRVVGRAGFELTGVQQRVEISRGELLVHEQTAGYEAGALTALLRIDAGRPVPFLEVRGDVRGVDLSRLLSQVKAQAEHAGTLDLGFELRGRGETLEAVLADLEGRVEGRLRDGVLASRYAREFMMELAHVSVPSLIPRRSTSVSCFAAAVRVEAGRAHVETLRLDSPKVSVTGTGSVDLAGNAYRLRLEPRPKDPNLLSVAANVNVTGPLAAPDFAPEPLSIATSAARAILSNVRRPTRSLRESLRIGKKGDPGCPVDPFTPAFD